MTTDRGANRAPTAVIELRSELLAARGESGEPAGRFSATVDAMVEVLERGDIQFFFRPSVQPADADRYVLGVQSFFLILSPEGSGRHRRLRIGRKRMPASPRERFWGRIERVGSLQRVLGDLLEADRYTTKTRGERYQPGARAIASGTYELVRHDDHVHLHYRVESFGVEDAPEELRLPETGRHLVLFERIPRARAIWTQHGSVAQLDEEGAELVLVGSPQDDHGADHIESRP